MRIPFVHEENKNNDFIQQFIFFRVSSWCMRVLQEPTFWCRTWMCCGLFTSIGMHRHASWYHREHPSKTDTEENKLLNKVIILVFFTHKKYSRSFIYHGWTTDVTWTVLTMSLLPFWALNVSVVLLSMQGQKALRFNQKYLNFQRWMKILWVWKDMMVDE